MVNGNDNDDDNSSLSKILSYAKTVGAKPKSGSDAAPPPLLQPKTVTG